MQLKGFKQPTHPSLLITCSSLVVICSLSRGPNLNRVQRDWRAGMILVRQLQIKQNLVFSVNFSMTVRRYRQCQDGISQRCSIQNSLFHCINGQAKLQWYSVHCKCFGLSVRRSDSLWLKDSCTKVSTLLCYFLTQETLNIHILALLLFQGGYGYQRKLLGVTLKLDLSQRAGGGLSCYSKLPLLRTPSGPQVSVPIASL